MVSLADAEGQLAPGELESVRTLLNTWLIPNDSRQPTDMFGEHAASQGWSRARAAVVRRLRDDLRGAVETGDSGIEGGRLYLGEIQKKDERALLN